MIYQPSLPDPQELEVLERIEDLRRALGQDVLSSPRRWYGLQG
jgi:hypothetical protein